MTNEYAENPKVFGRWQPRMLETHEAAEAFMQLLACPKEKADQGMFELLVRGSAEHVRVTWKRVHFDVREELQEWSESHPLEYAGTNASS